MGVENRATWSLPPRASDPILGLRLRGTAFVPQGQSQLSCKAAVDIEVEDYGLMPTFTLATRVLDLPSRLTEDAAAGVQE
jgi:hypothetical protein